jgi:GNAT superfamily N-acetyltransferase
VIRFVTKEDWSGWRAMWEGYVRFYRAELPEDVTVATFDRLCEQRDGLFGFVAESEPGSGEIVGIANAIVHPSTWTPAAYCYMEDLYVAPRARGSGTGEALIRAVAAEARGRGCAKVYWHTQEFNGRARSLYEQVARNVSFLVYQMEL